MDKGILIILAWSFIALGAVIIPVAGSSYFLSKYACDSQWREFKPEYGLVIGCTIEHKGKRIPSTAYRTQESD